MQYVSNIYKYYVAYDMLAEHGNGRKTGDGSDGSHGQQQVAAKG
ncbi:hypothetical protein OE766_15400 [Pararhizobium sp. YC-54]|nr:hypothetical protein [Pararhizobium sp. YC-54]MCV9999628.1 hypothetical protein [Pararhizobium sp. YC-54]